MATNSKYASTVNRFIALIIDAIILAAVGMLLGQLFGRAMESMMTLLKLILNAAYFIYFTSKDGQTPGKKVMKIKVVNESNGKLPEMTNIVLRETIGRIVSSLILGLGYIWAIFDAKKQTWHDKLGKTVVVNV